LFASAKPHIVRTRIIQFILRGVVHLNGIEAARDLVSRSGWLGQTPVEFQKAVLNRVLLRKYEVGETVYTIGDPTGGIYCLLHGTLRVAIAPDQHGPYLAHLLRPGTWFGEGPLISGRPRLIGLSATVPTEVLQLPLHALNDILRSDPGAWRWIAALTLGNFETAIGVISDLMMRDHVKRFVACLLRLGGCRGTTPNFTRAIEVDISQVDLATMSNVARTTANAILGDLDAKGMVKLTYRRIVILAPDKLSAMLDEK
jgi:CRP/FNR family transcriptional regulator, cyclic AMP receptor protein